MLFFKDYLGYFLTESFNVVFFLQTEEERQKAEKKAREHRKEMIADLDWWSKYYVTREDIDKVLEVVHNVLSRFQSATVIIMHPVCTT